MVAKTEENTTSRLDSVKLFVAMILMMLGITEFYYFEEESQLYRVLGVVAFALAAIAVVYTTQMGQNLVGFARESRTEVRKVVWPTRQETLQSTLMVVVLVLLFGIMLWLMDMVLLWAVRLLTGQGA